MAMMGERRRRNQQEAEIVNGIGACFCYCLLAIVVMIIYRSIFPSEATIRVEPHINVATKIVMLLDSDHERIQDITAGQELVRGLTFNLYGEKINCKVHRGIHVAEYDELMKLLQSRLQLSDEVVKVFREGKYGRENHEVIREFKFKKGEKGEFLFGRMATVRYGNEIDLAYTIYSVDFKLTDRVTRHEKDHTFLGFTLYTSVWHESVARDVSTKDEKYLKAYFLDKAIKGFKYMQ